MKQDGLEPLFRTQTGLLLDPYFSGTKVRWLLDHVDGVRARAEAGELAFGTIDAWILWNLTRGRVHATDASNASRTLLFDIHRMEWSADLLEMLDVPSSLLPEVVDSSGVIAETDRGLFGTAIPIAGIAGDQQAALFGQLCFDPGQTKNTYGTGCFMLRNTGSAPVTSQNNLLTTVAWRKNAEVTYALEGSVFIAGAVVQWLRDGLGLIQSSTDIEALAASVSDTGGVYLVPAFAGLGAPYWDPFARGTITGITRGTTAGHLARAALEGIAFQAADVLEAMNADAGEALTEMRVDGGASRNNLLMQVQSDILGVPVVRPAATETTARGAAFLAGLATGVWTPSDLNALWVVDRRFEPDASGLDVDARKQTWRRAVERARAWVQVQ